MTDDAARFCAHRRLARMSARKARLVADLVRGRRVEEALTLLRFTPKRAAVHFARLIESAVANARYQVMVEGVGDVDEHRLEIRRVWVDAGPRMKRWRPRSRGMVHRYDKKTCHLHVELAERPAEAED